MHTEHLAVGGYRIRAVAYFVILHLGLIAAFFVPPTRTLLLWLAGTYILRMFAVTAGYHRYFSHRSYRLDRVSQCVLAFLAETSGQKGVLWWAAQHRLHHRYSETERDIHSPERGGFWWSHMGWVLSPEHFDYDPKLVTDFARFPELRWLNRYHLFPPIAFGILVFLIGGPGAFVWGYIVSTVLLYHCSFSINSLAHVIGTRRFATPDNSRNNWWLAIITFGEGWHNNHHFSMSSCRQGFKWWEVDFTYMGLRLLSFLGIARDLRPFRAVEPKVQEADQRLAS